jgi:hypothetical protein
MARELPVIALALALALGSGCGGGKKSEPVPPGKPLAGKAFYRVDPGPATPCATGSTCELRLVLTALGDYHVNKDYPFKFVGDPAAAAPEPRSREDQDDHGQRAAPERRSREDQDDHGERAALDGEGSFALDGEKRGTMTIKFRPAAAGNAKVVGSFKLSVCTDEACEIESPRLELSAPVN